MTDGDKMQFAKIMTVLAEYYGREVSNGLIAVYWTGLQQFDLQAVREALHRHMANPDSGQFMPKIADVVKMLAGSTQDSALRAWAKVDQAVRQVGVYADVVFDDALIHRVIHDIGGWVMLGNKTEDEWPFVAREFENRYRGYKARGETPEYPPVLTGIANAHNRKGGFRTEPVKLIGNAAVAQSVMRAGTDAPLIELTTALLMDKTPQGGFNNPSGYPPIGEDEKTGQNALEAARRAYLEDGKW